MTGVIDDVRTLSWQKASFLQTQGKDESVRHIDRVGRLVFPAVFAVFFLAVWLL